MTILYVATYVIWGVIAVAIRLWACDLKPHALDYIAATCAFLLPWVYFIILIIRKIGGTK